MVYTYGEGNNKQTFGRTTFEFIPSKLKSYSRGNYLEKSEFDEFSKELNNFVSTVNKKTGDDYEHYLDRRVADAAR